jgi:hypothetical protein
MLARFSRTQLVPHPPNQQRFPEAQAIERHWGSQESTRALSQKTGPQARPGPPVYSVATQSFREHLGPTHPEHGGKKKVHSKNWEQSPMDPSWARRPKCLASDMASERSGRSGQMPSRPPVKTGPPPDPTRSAERSAVTKELPGRREKKTSPGQVETEGQRPRVRPSLLQVKMTRGWVSRMGKRELELGARVPPRQPMKRQSPGNRPHSARLWAPPRACLEALEQSPSLAHLEKRTSHADNPGRKFAEWIPKARADRPHWARLLARLRWAAPRKTHSRAAQALPDRGVLLRRATHPRTSAHPLHVREAKPASRPRSDHLYSWYWSTFTFSSTPMASSVRTAMEQ